ncbi:MotE family protein [Falsiroseomonas sp. HW251]|uniref:MotE family protein n=1 Tax=Falsiroseomonas sp. HW251 TaxID=3390998 RepID=UPI003D31EE4F
MKRFRPRLLPLAIATAALLVLVKAERLLGSAVAPLEVAVMAPPAAPRAMLAARAADAPPPPRQAAAPAVQPAPVPQAAPQPTAEQLAERAVLETLRARRAELEAREQVASQREVILAAAERRLTQRIEELTQLQSRLETLERDRAAREEAGLRGLVRLYEGMRPRDAAVIFDELEMPVLLPIADRMREAKAAPILAAMKPDRARALTGELARLRAERVEQERRSSQQASR